MVDQCIVSVYVILDSEIHKIGLSVIIVSGSPAMTLTSVFL